MTYYKLLGKKEEEVVNYFTNNNCKYNVYYTKKPHDKRESTENKVIRIKENNQRIEILVGYFKLPGSNH